MSDLSVLFSCYCSLLQGTYKVRNEIETKLNETKRNQRKRNETKRNEINENETKRNEINEMETKWNETNEIDWYEEYGRKKIKDKTK